MPHLIVFWSHSPNETALQSFVNWYIDEVTLFESNVSFTSTPPIPIPTPNEFPIVVIASTVGGLFIVAVIVIIVIVIYRLHRKVKIEMKEKKIEMEEKKNRNGREKNRLTTFSLFPRVWS